MGQILLYLFCSSKKRDANITDTLSSGTICFSSFQESGYHRTASEIADEKSVRETTFGGNLHFRNNWLKVGTTLVHYQLDKSWVKGEELKDLYDFEGTSLLNWGVDYTATLNRIQLFGETASGNQGWATLNGLLYNMNKYASFSLLYRNFQTGYFSMHSAAFSEGSDNNNEQAMYAGTVLHPFRNWQLSAYADFYRFPWLSYRVNAPSAGSDYLVQVDYSTARKVEMFIRLRFENNPENEVGTSQTIPVVYSLKRTGLRYHISLPVSEQLALQNRIELIRVRSVQNENDNGIMLYQDIEYRTCKSPVDIEFPVCLV